MTDPHARRRAIDPLDCPTFIVGPPTVVDGPPIVCPEYSAAELEAFRCEWHKRDAAFHEQQRAYAEEDARLRRQQRVLCAALLLALSALGVWAWFHR